jgi:hypothetical protein
MQGIHSLLFTVQILGTTTIYLQRLTVERDLEIKRVLFSYCLESSQPVATSHNEVNIVRPLRFSILPRGNKQNLSSSLALLQQRVMSAGFQDRKGYQLR